jgi:hypothetical protein
MALVDPFLQEIPLSVTKDATWPPGGDYTLRLEAQGTSSPLSIPRLVQVEQNENDIVSAYHAEYLASIRSIGR